MLRRVATGLRALGLKPASLQRIAQASLPAPRSHRAPAGQGQNQKTEEAGILRIGLRALGHKPVPKTPACAPAPDSAACPFASLGHVPEAASRIGFALDQAPHHVSAPLGTLLPLSLVGTRSCLCRDRLSQRWGASFSLRRLGAAYHGSPALGGLRKVLLGEAAKSFCRFLWPLGRPARIVWLSTCKRGPENRLGCGALAQSSLRHRANADQSQFKHLSIEDEIHNKELIKSYAAY